jgi:dipeptidyl aminopeptidase/acylaminoacyl peptidase
MARFLLALLLLIPLGGAAGAAESPTLADFLKKDTFETLSISPDGNYFAATMEREDRGQLLVLRRGSLEPLANAVLPKNMYVQSLVWATNDRLLYTVMEKRGQLEQPQPTGEIFAINADGSRTGPPLVGMRADSGGLHTRIRKSRSDALFAQLIGLLPDDERRVLVAVGGADLFTRADRMDIVTGRRLTVAKAPLRRGSFMPDQSGLVRFVTGYESDSAIRPKTLYRDSRGGDWQPLLADGDGDLAVSPIGFAADGKTAYLEIEQPQGPNAIYAFDTGTGKRTRVMSDPTVNPARYLRSPIDQSPYAVLFMDGLPRAEYFDPEDPFARLHRSLQASFPGLLVLPLSFTRDANLMLFLVHSDRVPGEFYLFDRSEMRATHIASRSAWLDPDRLGETRAISLAARDGTALHGYLTLPPGSDGKNLPLIVNPHGGPFGAFDIWGFSTERQMLAVQGYAVLQVNFRGSGNYGRAFEVAGYREWGGRMQDDVTDATRWAVEQGVADPQRLCIYGGSYGAYAALMGAVREPTLYRCAAGTVGVYDMEAMYREGDVPETRMGKQFLLEILGKTDLKKISPNHLAEQIQVPVFLAAGAEDVRAPPVHTERMRDALKRAGREVEAHIYPGEGHGFFTDAARRDYFTRLLAFFDRNIGPGSVDTGAVVGGKADAGN